MNAMHTLVFSQFLASHPGMLQHAAAVRRQRRPREGGARAPRAARGGRWRSEDGLHAPSGAAACLREMSCGAHLREKGGRDEAALVAAMPSQRRHGPREGGNDVRGEGLGGCVGCCYSGLRD
jgi:hypothetical protein